MLLWIIAWLSTALWLGTLSLANAVAVDERIQRLQLAEQFAVLYITVQRRLALVAVAAGIIVLVATVVVEWQGARPTGLNFAIIVILLGLEPVATILAVFHVERQPAQNWLSLLQSSLVILIYGIITGKFVAALPGRLPSAWPVFIAAGYLLGLTGASALLLHSLARLEPIGAAGIVAQVVSQWTLSMATGLLGVFLATVGMVTSLRNSALIGVGLMVGLSAAPIIGLVVLRCTTLGALWRSLIAPPLSVAPARRLRVRLQRSDILRRRVLNLCICCGTASAISALVLMAVEIVTHG